MAPSKHFEKMCKEASLSNECICINDEWTGFVRAVRGGQFLMELVSETGRPDGLICGMIADIEQIDRRTRHIKRVEFLLRQKKTVSQEEDKLDIGHFNKEANYCRAVLMAANQSGAIVAVEVSGEQRMLWGRVRGMRGDAVAFVCLDDCGNVTENRKISLKAVESVLYGSLEAKLTAMCEGHVF